MLCSLDLPGYFSPCPCCLQALVATVDDPLRFNMDHLDCLLLPLERSRSLLTVPSVEVAFQDEPAPVRPS